MKDSIVNEVMEMVDTFLGLVTIEDELDRQLAAAYIFGMVNGTAQKESVPYTRGCPRPDGLHRYR